jgi:membrane fusion protein (multidrug efflux system)
MRSMGADGVSRSLWALLAAALFALAWTLWFFTAHVTVLGVSRSARLEVDSQVHPIAALIGGRVTESHLVLGRMVQAGEVLVELDAESEKRRLEEETRRLDALEPQLDALQREIAAEQQVPENDRVATVRALRGLRARQKEVETSAKFAGEQARRASQVKDGLPEIELLRMRAEEEQKRVAVRALSLDAERLTADQRTRDAQYLARVEELERQRAVLEGQYTTTAASIEVLKQEIEKHHLRAPATGRIGEIEPLQIGAVLRQGDRVGTVVPSGRLKIVAEFTPAEALGRIQPAQVARMRLDGFPWAQYGSVDAEVETVASEIRSGFVRVELSVTSTATRIPMQHGLPGTVEVEVEAVTPATLALRAAGQLLAGPSPSEPPAATDLNAAASEQSP